MSHSHKPSTGLKQQNKKFKTRHASKGDTKKQAKGRTSRVTPKGAAKAAMKASQTRQDRQNKAKQLQLKKRNDLLIATRAFCGTEGVPRIVAVIPLCSDVSAAAAAKALATSVGAGDDTCPSLGTWKLPVERFKTSLQFVLLPYRQLYMALDACKAADYVVFVLSPTTEVDSWGELLMRSLQAQGLPEVVSVMHTRVHDLSATSGALNAARAVCEGRPDPVRWREGRAHVLAENVEWEAEGNDEICQLGSLRVTGFIRGAPLSANRLVHIPNHGDFQIEKIISAPQARTSKFTGLSAMDVEPTILSEATPDDAESLTSKLDPDTMANEQTWPTEDEMATGSMSNSRSMLPDAAKGTTPKRVIKRVPRGTSAYQAAWIVDEDDGEDEDEESDEDGDGDEKMDEGSVEGSEKTERVVEEVEEEEDLVDLDVTNEDMESSNGRMASKSTTFEDLDMADEKEQHDAWLASRGKKDIEREREEADEADFPDEVDTPHDTPARERFARYRGLRSFRTSPWDPFENLPLDYARIYRFEDYERTKRNVRRRAGEEGVQAGTRVTIYLKNVPKACAKAYSPETPFVIFGLWQYEHKSTVLHFAVQRNTEYHGSVRSKDPLVLCVGPRRFTVNPVYSQHSRGGSKGTNNVHKFERYLKHGQTMVATVYGPVAFGKVPCVLMRENEMDGEGVPPFKISFPRFNPMLQATIIARGLTPGYACFHNPAPDLVASGTFLNPDTKRIIAKRIILTGHPYKVHRKTATVRFMFFNPADVMYFKPIELRTKYGMTGHISESLGTHGYFKAHFDQQIGQQDTVCMNLYKRVYARWSAPHVAMQGGGEDDEVMKA
ncbi:hypothetical protein FRB96_005235 [Tulasnella sp. 330]|nr:hypothetical protein FRB96_005235 [Tulasnella sp. 330]